MKKLIVASITPFDGQDQINEQAVKQLWDRNLAEGADGFVHRRQLRGVFPAQRAGADPIHTSWARSTWTGRRFSPT